MLYNSKFGLSLWQTFAIAGHYQNLDANGNDVGWNLGIGMKMGMLVRKRERIGTWNPLKCSLWCECSSGMRVQAAHVRYPVTPMS